jgi:hypothetical protein
MLMQLFGFRLPHTPNQPQSFDRKNTVVGKCYLRAATVYNKRFCEMSAVTPQKRQCKIESYYPAGTFVEAATAPICQTL